MSRRPHPAPAEPLPIAEAMRASAALGQLTARLRESNALLAALAGVLPAPLAGQVRAGPIDEAGWSLLCANAAVAAKLRQLVPHFEQHLHARGHTVASIRIKVRPM